MKQGKRQLDILDGYLSLEQTRNNTLNQMAFYEYDNPKYKLLDKKLDKIDNDLDVQAKQGAKVFGNMSDFLDILNEYSENKTAVKTRLLNNPTSTQLAKCRKVLAEQERETHKPTISHYRDMKNGTKTDAQIKKALLKPVYPKDEFLLNWLVKHGNATQKREATKRLKLLQSKNGTTATAKNPSSEKIALVKLRDKFKLKSPRPFEQLTANDKYLIAKYPQYFEVDNGYVYLMKKVRRNPTTATVKRASNPKTVKNEILSLAKKITNTQDDELGLNATNANIRTAQKYFTYFKLTNQGTIKLTDKGYDFLNNAERHRKPNHSNTDFNSFVQATTRKNSRMFQGKLTGEQTQLTAPNGTPKNLSRLGELKLMVVKMRNGNVVEVKFDKNAYLAMDIRRNLHCVGNGAKINGVKVSGTGLAELGRLIQIDYVTDKKHINGNKLTHFYHKLGEVTGETPRLFVDTERFPIIHGGNYDVWNVGIVN